MAKPTLANSRWADLGTNNVAPSSGQRNSGWTPNQIAISSYFNALALEYYRWFEFLDAIFGTNGAITLPTNQSLTTQGTGQVVCAGNATVGGTLGVTGLATVGGTLGVTGTATVGNLSTAGFATVAGALSGGATTVSTLGATGLVTAAAGLTAGNNTHVSISGSGRFKHGTFTRTVSAMIGYPTAGSPTFLSMNWIAASGSDEISVPIQMEVGERFSSIFAGVNDTGGSNLTAKLFRLDMNTNNTTQVGATGNSSSTGAQYISISGLTEVVEANYVYSVVINSGQTGDRIGGITVSYDHP